MSALHQDERFAGYVVQNLLKENVYSETYKVADDNGDTYFLKLFRLKNMPERMLQQGIVKEIRYCSALRHANLISHIRDGQERLESGDYQYLVTNYFSGELLIEKIEREGKMEMEEAVSLFLQILDGVKYMHEQRPPLCHNDITPSNIMLSAKTGGIPELIDMGHVGERANGNPTFETSDLDPFYRANETFIGVFDEQSDIFSACAVFYTMLVGRAPWYQELPAAKSLSEHSNRIRQFRKTHPLDFGGVSLPDWLRNVLYKGLSLEYQYRYDTVEQLITAIRERNETFTPPTSTISGEGISGAHNTRRTSNPTDPRHTPGTGGPSESGSPSGSDRPYNSGNPSGPGNHGSPDPNQNPDAEPGATQFRVQRGNGKGFEDIAGMQELKDLLKQKVIFVLQNRELAEQYRLTPPNGMLLYGPPGCGKTFFAEKFSEEAGFNYILIKASDLASTYVHGSQEKIAALFKEAEQNAPCVLNFDEFDALVPVRSGDTNQHYASEVNEFLSQLNNCSHRKIFVIATSNRPDKIDPAVLRTGRIDKQIYVPLPDFTARKEMFLHHLKGRPMEDNIDAERLATLSDGYVASDIAYVVNDAAMTAAFTHKKISQELLESIVVATKPSVKKEVLKQYDEIRERMDGVAGMNDRKRIGFF